MHEKENNNYYYCRPGLPSTTLVMAAAKFNRCAASGGGQLNSFWGMQIEVITEAERHNLGGNRGGE